MHMRWRDVRGGLRRLANRLLKRVRDFAQVKYDGYITEEVADYALDLLDVDKEGLDQTDRGILLAMIGKFGGGPVGLETLAASIGEDPGTIEDVYEPYLLKNGFIQRTPRGRVVTDAAYAIWEFVRKMNKIVGFSYRLVYNSYQKL